MTDRSASLCCVLALLIAPGCGAGLEPDGLQAGESRPSGPYGAPPAHDIAPPGAIRFTGQPIAPDTLTGRWHTPGECVLELGEAGAQSLSGPVRLSGDCTPGLHTIAAWRLEPESRARLSLHDTAGGTVWAGVAAGPGRLSGHLADGGRLDLQRR